MSIFPDHMNSTEFLQGSFFLAIVLILEKPMIFFSKRQFGAFEMENNEINLLIQAM